MNATMGDIASALAKLVREELGELRRYQYNTVEVDPASDKLQDTIDEYAAAGWRLVAVVPTYSTEWTNPNENQTDVHVGSARLIWERLRE